MAVGRGGLNNLLWGSSRSRGSCPSLNFGISRDFRHPVAFAGRIAKGSLRGGEYWEV